MSLHGLFGDCLTSSILAWSGLSGCFVLEVEVGAPLTIGSLRPAEFQNCTNHIDIDCYTHMNYKIISP